MSDKFSMSRLNLVLKNHLAEHRQRYTYYALGVFLIGAIIYAFALWQGNFSATYDEIKGNEIDIRHTKWEIYQNALYLGGLFIFGAIFACVSFVNFSNKGEAIFYFIKPASQFEKWLAEVIIRIIVFFLAYTVIFYIIDIPAIWYVRAKETSAYMEDWQLWTAVQKADKVFHPTAFFCFSSFEAPGLVVYPIVISAYISIITFFMYGAVLFNSYSFFKTLLLAFTIACVYISFAFFLFEGRDLPLIDGWYLQSMLKAHKLNYEAEIQHVYSFVAGYFLLIFIPGVLLTCSYLKLKEKEV